MTGDFEGMALYAAQGVDKIDAIVRLVNGLRRSSRLHACCSLVPGWREVRFGSLADIAAMIELVC
jgi:hypothetical protein